MLELFIITGSNGAGKSSIGPEYLPVRIRRQGPIFDGDKLFVEKRKELWRNIKSHKECSKLAGYSIHLIFLGLQDTALSELRVVDRSQAGGHYVDPRTVADNFYGNLEKLNQHYEMFQTVQIIDTSEAEHIVLAVLKDGNPVSALAAERLPPWFQHYLPSITQKIRDGEPKG